MNAFRTCILPAVLGVCAVAQSQAQTTAHASVANVAWELIDLTPDDGVAPSISFDVTGNFNFVEPRLSLALIDKDPSVSRYKETSVPLFTPLADSLSYTDSNSTPVTKLSASAASTVNLQTGMSAQVQASSDPIGGLAAAFVDSGYIHFILAPNSALKLSADLEASGAFDPSSSMGYTYAAARLFYFANVPESSTNWYPYTMDSVEYEAGDSPEGSVASHVEGLISNGTASPAVSAFAFNAHVITNTAPVPEPATYAMLAAGLLVIGGTLRRRRRAADVTDNDGRSIPCRRPGSGAGRTEAGRRRP